MTPHFNLLDENALETAEKDVSRQKKPAGRIRTGTSDSRPEQRSSPGTAKVDSSVSEPNPGAAGEGKSRFWLWLLLLIAIAAGLGYFLYFQPALKVEYPWPEFRIFPTGHEIRYQPRVFLRGGDGRHERFVTARYQFGGIRMSAYDQVWGGQDFFLRTAAMTSRGLGKGQTDASA